MKVFDKFAFFQDLGYVPHAGQLPIHRSKASRRIVACGVRWGKSRLAAMEALAAAMEPRAQSRGWIVAPSYDLGQKVFREIVHLATSRLRHRIRELKESERVLYMINLAGGISEIRVKSADSLVSLLGEALDWVIIDEAAQLKPIVWQSYVSQRLLDRKGWALIISTPHGRGWLYDAYRRGKGNDPDYESWNAPSWENPLLSSALIEAERARLSERVFRQEYGGEFLEGSGSVFHNVRDLATGIWKAPDPGCRYYAGLDLARVDDYSVLVIVNLDREVVYVDRFQKLDWGLQVNRITAACDNYRKARILCDTTGAGQPVYELLRGARNNVEPYVFSARTKSDLIINLSIMMERKQLVLPKADLWPEGIDELESYQYTVTESENVRTNAPSGQHDDCVIALALAAWQVRKPPARIHFTVTDDWNEIRRMRYGR